MSPTQRRFIVVGYNNVRLFDVAQIRERCRRHFDAGLVLVVEKVQPGDREAADELLSCSFAPGDGAASLARIEALLQGAGLQPLGVLPFADRGVALGTALAQRLGLPGGDVQRAVAGLDKVAFRRLEQASATHPPGYVPLRCTPVRSYAEFAAAVAYLDGRAFVKPAQEGNSRGCMAITRLEQCPQAWEALQPYRQGGIIVEACADASAEFSADRVAGRRWITAKTTTLDSYRCEIQQIVPALLPPATQALIEAAGEHMCELVSPTHGAFHNEILLLRHGAGVAAVETNMRPAGMKIWDLAALAFEDFDPWLEWIRWSASGVVEERPLQRRRYAGIRQLRAPRRGLLRQRPDLAAVAQELGFDLLDGGWSKAPGDVVAPEVVDNAGFIGHVVLADEDADRLQRRLLALAGAVEARVGVEPVPAVELEAAL